MLIVTHTGYNKFLATDCFFPWLYNDITFFYTLSIFALFLNFYYQTYVRKGAAGRKGKARGSLTMANGTNGLPANGTAFAKAESNGLSHPEGNSMRHRTAGNAEMNGAIQDIKHHPS